MSLSYSFHARERMLERGITEAEVEAVVADPQIQYPGNPDPQRPPSIVCRGTINGRSLKVIVREYDELVISVMSPDE